MQDRPVFRAPAQLIEFLAFSHRPVMGGTLRHRGCRFRCRASTEESAIAERNHRDGYFAPDHCLLSSYD
jgi:hypothetical protein